MGGVLNLPFSAVASSSGTWSVNVPLTGPYSSWTVFAVVDAGGGLVVVQNSGVPAAQVPMVNGAVTVGPIFTPPMLAPYATISGTGFQSGANISGVLNGMWDEASTGLAGVSGQGFSVVGATQSDPSQLLVGQVGPPIVDNFTIQIPKNSFVDIFSQAGVVPAGSGVNVGGYAALLLRLDPNTTTNVLWAQLVWNTADDLATVTYTDIGSIVPLFAGVVGNLTSNVQLRVYNADNSLTHGVVCTVIPIAEIPPRPDLLLDNGLAGVNTPFPDSHVIISAQPVVAGGNTTTILGNFVWNGRAILSVVTTGTSYDCQVSTIDALGNQTFITRIENVVSAAPQEIQLSSGLVNLAFHNTGAGSLTPFISLIATS